MTATSQTGGVVEKFGDIYCARGFASARIGDFRSAVAQRLLEG